MKERLTSSNPISDLNIRTLKKQFLSTDAREVENGVQAFVTYASAHPEQSLFAIAHELLPNNVTVSPDTPSSWARIYRACLELARNADDTAIEVIRAIVNSIEQNPQMLHPKHLLAIAKEYGNDQRIPPFIANGILGSVAYALRFFTNTEYEAVIAEQLDFENASHFASTAQFLELMRHLYNTGSEFSYGESIVATRVHNALSRALEKGAGSYLLNMRARELLDMMDGVEHIWSDRDSVPFEIAPGIFAFDGSDGLRVAPKERGNQIRSDIQELRSLEKSILNSGKTQWSSGDPLLRRRKALYTKLWTVGEVLDARSLTRNDANAASDYADYRYLISKPIRSVIERDFGVPLTALTIREQFHLAQYLKAVPEGRVASVREFSHRFGRDGLRTFLSLEHDRNMGDVILELAHADVTEGQKRAIFELYGRIIDAGSDAAENAVAEKTGKAARDVLARAHLSKDEPEKIQALLEKISVEGQVLLSTYRALRESGKAKNVEDVAGVTYEILPSSSLPSKDMDALGVLYWKNYKEKPETAAMLVEKFKEHCAQEGAYVHRITYKNKVLAFLLVEPKGEHRIHVSALNVDPELVGIKPGPSLLKKILDLVHKGHTIEAEAVPRLASQYEDQYGFQKVGEFTDSDGEFLIKLELRPPSSEISSTAPQTETDVENR